MLGELHLSKEDPRYHNVMVESEYVIISLALLYWLVSVYCFGGVATYFTMCSVRMPTCSCSSQSRSTY